MARLLSRNISTAAAYTLVDLGSLEDDELRKDIIEDANAGGGNYGIRVVEEVVNGGARAPLYGYYRDGPDADKWNAAKKELGLSATDVDDSTVAAGAGGLPVDPRREAALREQAAQTAEAEADRIRAGEDAEVLAVTGETDSASTVRGGADSATDSHPTNIVDSTLDPDATNRVEDADAAEKPKAKSTTKTPK